MKMINKMMNKINEVKQGNINKEELNKENEMILEAYEEAKKQWEIACQNFDNADESYIDVATMELNAKQALMEQIRKEIKSKKQFTM